MNSNIIPLDLYLSPSLTDAPGPNSLAVTPLASVTPMVPTVQVGAKVLQAKKPAKKRPSPPRPLGPMMTVKPHGVLENR